ncbi:MAG TPA: hypothetical protein VLJ21_02060 [Candidatus Binatia bacterium]|nr:hypothetical protein [Candidatus Binatia bacterium]
MKKLLVKRGQIRAHIDVPGVSLDLNVAESAAALREVRRILDSLHALPRESDFSVEYEPAFGWAFSEELRSSPAAMDFIRQASRAEEGTLYRKICLDNIRVVDTYKKEHYATLDINRTREQVATNLGDVSKAHFGLVHVMSTVSKDDKALLVDLVRKKLGNTDLKTHFTHKDVLGRTVVEVVLFGNFPREDF